MYTYIHTQVIMDNHNRTTSMAVYTYIHMYIHTYTLTHTYLHEQAILDDHCIYTHTNSLTYIHTQVIMDDHNRIASMAIGVGEETVDLADTEVGDILRICMHACMHVRWYAYGYGYGS
jgi:hypothetical protein